MPDGRLLPAEELKEKLSEPAIELRYLLSKGYKRRNTITFVSNHHRLREQERQILSRLVFSPETAEGRIKKKLTCSQLGGCDLFVDGYNVIISIENVLKNELIWLADDGFLRDTCGVFNKHRITDMTLMAVDEMLSTLAALKVRSVTILLDSQMSNSGRLAVFIRKKSENTIFKVDVMTSKHVDFDLKKAGEYAVIATADSVIIDAVNKVVDMMGCWLKQNDTIAKPFNLNVVRDKSLDLTMENGKENGI